MADDILRPLALSQVQKLITICSQNIPKCIKGRNYLAWYLKIQNLPFKSGIFKVKLFSHRSGNLNNCTYVGITDESDYHVYSFSTCAKELAECLGQTKRIKWHLNPYLVSFEEDHKSELLKQLPSYRACDFPHTLYYLKQNDARSYEINVPSNVILKEIDCKESEVLNDLWPHKYPGSDLMIDDFVKLSISRGVYCKISGELLSWGVVNEMLGLGVIQTQENERRKGYSELVIKSLAKAFVAEHDLELLSAVIKGNKASESLMAKLGLHALPGDVNWLKLKPITET